VSGTPFTSPPAETHVSHARHAHGRRASHPTAEDPR
jgi:hypothetical protein